MHEIASNQATISRTQSDPLTNLRDVNEAQGRDGMVPTRPTAALNKQGFVLSAGAAVPFCESAMTAERVTILQALPIPHRACALSIEKELMVMCWLGWIERRPHRNGSLNYFVAPKGQLALAKHLCMVPA